MGDQDPNANAGGNADGDDDADKFVTQDQVSQIVNAAVSNHMKRFGTKLSETIGGVIDEKLKGFVPKQNDDVDDDDDDDPPDPKAKADPRFTQMKRQITQLTNKLNDALGDADSERKQRRNDGLNTAVLKHLGEGGMSGKRLTAAKAVLYQDGRVKVTDEGEHLFVDDDGLDVPLKDGLATWVASDDAKLFLPPKDVRGSGDKGGGDQKLPKMKTDELSQAYADAVEGVEKHLLNQY